MIGIGALNSSEMKKNNKKSYKSETLASAYTGI